MIRTSLVRELQCIFCKSFGNQGPSDKRSGEPETKLEWKVSSQSLFAVACLTCMDMPRPNIYFDIIHFYGQKLETVSFLGIIQISPQN